MVSISRVLLVVFSLVLILGLVESFDYHDKDLESEERLWDFRDLKEKHKRFNVFRANVKHFADMTRHEFKSSYDGSRVKHYRMVHGPRRTTLFMYDNVRRVHCWAFSTIVGVEGINQIKTNKLVSLSEQELVDCDNIYNQDCNGGLMENALEFIKQRGRITTEQDYPYVAEDGTCEANKENAHVVTIDGHEMVPAGDEEDLMKVILNLIGVFTSPKYRKEIDHGVAIRGEKGYSRVERGSHTKGGLCGIDLEASYPLKSSPNPTKARARSSSSIKDEP
ncbi:hypothetical protein MKX01_017102 [Papaver californicum]|nr:hypothetical protein MKX01_017102 [Papaver californicum]